MSNQKTELNSDNNTTTAGRNATTPLSAIMTAATPVKTSSSLSGSSTEENGSLFRSNFASSPGSVTSPSTSTSTSTTAASFFARSLSSASPTSPSSNIQYDHETYLELLAGKSSAVEKTASQLYREERARKLSLRARDPAVLSGPVDLDMGAFHLCNDDYSGTKYPDSFRQ